MFPNRAFSMGCGKKISIFLGSRPWVVSLAVKNGFSARAAAGARFVVDWLDIAEKDSADFRLGQ
jgi:hypothetical protein